MKFTMKIKKLINKLINFSGRYSCNSCNSNVIRFTPISKNTIEYLDKLITADKGFETLCVDSYFCPICGANDRDRLILSYIYNKSRNNQAILEIAPSSPIRARLKISQNYYRSCDLFMSDVDDKCDITNMSCYLDQSFDIVICSHVLEHIHEDTKAISEIARVLKPQGEALILVPIPIGLQENLYDPEIVDIETRVKMYGQDDHVRMYSKSGLTDLIVNSGLKLKTWTYLDDELGFEKMGLSPTSTLYIGVKEK